MDKTIILVTGASRGLGLEFCRQYLHEESSTVLLATCRQPARATALQALAASHPGRCEVLPLDVTDEASLETAGREIAAAHPRIDLLINNAGIGGGRLGLAGGTRERLREVFETNTISPLRVALAFLPLLRRGRRPLLANITSRLGSIALKGTFSTTGGLAYAASKAALNSLSRELALLTRDDGIIVLAQSPGWASTDMGGPAATMTPAQVVSGMRRVFARATLADTGRFLEYDGSEIPW
jgi:NAD(P)-dependent dehydrogenase (short-subunit alcohol dehydrogenase family)